MENWTEVPFPSFPIPHVPNLLKNKTEGTKNKGRKIHECISYLTLNFIHAASRGKSNSAKLNNFKSNATPIILL
jgi:hypothetical protein